MKHCLRNAVIVCTLVLALLGRQSFGGPRPRLVVKNDGPYHSVSIALDGRTILKSPAEGLWSIASDWKDRWPAGWAHAHATTVEQTGPWTILKGQLETDAGTWALSDAYRPEGNTIKCVRRFVWQGTQRAERTTLSVRFQCPGKGADILLPGILYYGNPSGARSGRVPVYTGQIGEEAYYEEHRFPMPYACIEWADPTGGKGAAIHALPCPVPFGNRPDQWWSMGLTGRADGTELALLSGPCASNGRRSVVKALQRGFVPYDRAYLDVPPGAIIEKTFYLDAYDVATQGSGFQRPTRTTIELFTPFSTDGMPTFRDIIEAKFRFAKTRWRETAEYAGFWKYPDRNYFVIGWCGQAASCGYALQVLADGLADPNIGPMVQKSLDFLATTKFHDRGFCTWYDGAKKEWMVRGNPEMLSQGQGMLNFANAIEVAQENEFDVTRWERFLKRACDFHAERILSDDWNPKSTNEGFFIAPLCKAYRLFDIERYKAAAIKAGRVYASRHLDMSEPYWGGTLDASCEDKEGAFAALQGFVALYELTKDRTYLTWAAHACDVALTYVVVWDIDLPAGRLRDHAFKPRGWTAVSVQNQHIDVFGVLIAPDVYRLGQHLDREDLKKLAIVMYRSCGQLIDPHGSQGEQPHHTNYAQARPFTQRIENDGIEGIRGNYVENWTVFWITAHFLNAAAQFDRLGVPIWE